MQILEFAMAAINYNHCAPVCFWKQNFGNWWLLEEDAHIKMRILGFFIISLWFILNVSLNWKKKAGVFAILRIKPPQLKMLLIALSELLLVKI